MTLRTANVLDTGDLPALRRALAAEQDIEALLLASRAETARRIATASERRRHLAGYARPAPQRRGRVDQSA